MHRKKILESAVKTVNDLLPGERGFIQEITAPESIRQRIMDLGIIEGVMIEMIRSAPLGDPVQIKVLDTLLALRRSEASMLVIERVGETDHGRKRYRHRFGRESQQR